MFKTNCIKKFWAQQNLRGSAPECLLWRRAGIPYTVD